MNRNRILVSVLTLILIGCTTKRETTIVYDTSSSGRSNQISVPSPSQPVTVPPPGNSVAQTADPNGQQIQTITIGPKDEPAQQPNAGASQLPAMPKEGPTAAQAPAPDKAPKLPPESAMKHHGDTVISPSGLKYIDLKPGSGPIPQAGEFVSVSYVGKFTNGKQFDVQSSFTTPVGVGQLILGWDEATLTMKKGGKRRLIIPPSLAYGAAGSPPRIPPNSTLIYDVDVLLIQQ